MSEEVKPKTVAVTLTKPSLLAITMGLDNRIQFCERQLNESTLVKHQAYWVKEIALATAARIELFA